MAFNTGSPIGSTSPKDLSDNARNLDLLLLGDDPSYPDRKGVPRKSWKSMEIEHQADQVRRESEFDADQYGRAAEFSAAQSHRESTFNAWLDASGFENPPLLYTDGRPLQVDRASQLVDRGGNLYTVRRPASFPYTLTGSWKIDETHLVFRDDQPLRQDLADPTVGLKIVDWRRTNLSLATSGAQRMLDALPVSLWETQFVMLITHKPDPDDPNTWDWTPACQAAANAAAGKTLIIPKHAGGSIYNFSAGTPYVTGGTNRIAGVVFSSNTRILIDPCATIRPINWAGAGEFRALFATLGQSNVHFEGACLFDGLVPPGSSTVGNPKLGVMFQESTFCSIENSRAQNFVYHGFGCYAGDSGGSEDIDFIRVKSVGSAGSSLIAYSSKTNYGHQPNKRIRFIGCQGLDSPGFFGVELRGCEDSEVIGGLYSGNATGGVNIEENSHRVRVRGAEITGNDQGMIISGNQGACNDVITEDCFIHGNTASQWANYAGNRAKIIRSRIKGGASTGVNILIPTSGLPAADGVEIIDSEITGNGGVGVLNRGSNTKLSGTTVTGNAGVDIQVSNDGMRSINSTVGSWAYDLPTRRVHGYSTDLDAMLAASSLNVTDRYSSDGDRVRVVGESITTGAEFGSIDFVRQSLSSGRVEVYGYISSARSLLATFTRDGDLEFATTRRGPIMRASDGSKWRLLVSATGGLSTVAVP